MKYAVYAVGISPDNHCLVTGSNDTTAADKLDQGIGEFDTYIRNNQEFIPNFWREIPAGRDDQHRLRRIDN
jgi:hypothetical protein